MDWLITNPLFTWLLPAASLPVIFHLFFKLKKRPRVFPTLMFFEAIDPKLSARRQIRQWLVLLLRTLFILFLLLALARPVWLIGGGSGSVALVCIVDNSGSMSAPFKGEQTKLRTAIEAARALVGNITGNDAAGVVTLVEDPTVALPEGLSSDRAPVKAALDRIVETEATGDPAGALQRAFVQLETSSATRFEVHIFTDLQETEWGRAVGNIRPPRAGTTILIHRIPSAPLAGNVAITGIELPQKRLLAGRPIPLRLTLANQTTSDADIKLHWTDDADNNGLVEIAMPRESEKTVPVIVTPSAAGFHWLFASVEGDALHADNKAGIGFIASERAPVLFIGNTNEFGLLPLALGPAASGLLPVFGTAGDVSNQLLVVTTWDRVEGLGPYVERGGNLLVTPAAKVSAVLPAMDWLGASCGPVETPAKGAPVLVFRKNAPVLADLAETPLRSLKAFKFCPLRPVSDGEAVLGLDDGRALLVEHRFGRGTVFTSGLVFDSTWSTLPLKGGFLAIAQSMALAGRPETTISLVAGQRVSAPATVVKSLAGSPLDWKGERPPVLPRAGVYVADARHLAVRSSAREGIAKFIDGNQVAALAGLNYTVQTFESIESFLKNAVRVGRGVDLYLPLLLAATLALLLEAWLANPPPRKMKTVSAPRPAREPVGVA